MFKITVPIKVKEEVENLIDAGADELYCGYLSEDILKAYKMLEFEKKGPGSNFASIKDLREAIKTAHGRDVPVFMALNSWYINKQYPLLLDLIDKTSKIGIDGYIIADVGLILTLREKGFDKPVHISNAGTVFNSQTLEFYRELGASRVILDRQNDIGNIKEIASRRGDMEVEVFILNTLCTYVEGFCNFIHDNAIDSRKIENMQMSGSKKTLPICGVYDYKYRTEACCIDYNVKCFDASSGEWVSDKAIKPVFYKRLIDGDPCGACAIYDISKADVNTLKIVGRQYDVATRLRDTRFIKRCINILNEKPDISKSSYISEAKELYREFFDYKGECMGNNCYYPEAAFGE